MKKERKRKSERLTKRKRPRDRETERDIFAFSLLCISHSFYALFFYLDVTNNLLNCLVRVNEFEFQSRY